MLPSPLARAVELLLLLAAKDDDVKLTDTEPCADTPTTPTLAVLASDANAADGGWATDVALPPKDARIVVLLTVMLDGLEGDAMPCVHAAMPTLAVAAQLFVRAVDVAPLVTSRLQLLLVTPKMFVNVSTATPTLATALVLPAV